METLHSTFNPTRLLANNSTIIYYLFLSIFMIIVNDSRDACMCYVPAVIV